MMIDIFTEGSQTTSRQSSEKSLEEYLQGSFQSIKTTADILRDFGSVETHILSESMGYVRGNEKSSKFANLDNSRGDYDSAVLEMRTAIENSAQSSDVIIILLSSDTFKDLLLEKWEEIAESAMPDRIWCIGTSKSSLDLVDLGYLRRKGCDVITYRRTGVARIGKPTREDLVHTIEEKIQNERKDHSR